MREGLLRAFRWHAARLLPNPFGLGRPFSNAKRRRVLMLSEPGSIPQSQVFPFHFYQREIFARWQHELREVSTAVFETAPENAPGHADVVCVQTWFDLTSERCEKLFASIRTRNPSAKIVYLDSFAPTDLRLAAMLDSHVDLYLKKHLFRDRSRYFEPTRGDTNLVDYYGRRYGLEYKETHHVIPEGFLRKLMVGPSFCASPYMLPEFFDHRSPRRLSQRIDVHARLGTSGGGWYQAMREDAVKVIDGIGQLNVASQPGVRPSQYRRELRSSRTCFSPFGYGEVCWRDYEAVLYGALLIKPEMGHVATEPDIFVPDVTYVPVAWDFGDVQQVLDAWLKDAVGRAAVVERAYQRLHDYARTGGFVDQMRPIFQD